MELYTIRPSMRLTLARVALHGLAAIALVLADIAWGWRGIGLAAIAVSLGTTLRRKRPVELRCGDGGELWLREEDWREARLLSDTLVTPALTVLRLKVAGRRWSQSVPVLADSLAPNDFRRLRLWLRWRARPDGVSDRKVGNGTGG